MDVTTNETVEQARQAREREYGTYAATESITINGVLAFNAGDPVPVGHVRKYGLDGVVRRVSGGASDAPPHSASKADWVAYAVSKGKLQAEAEAVTKDDLIAEFG